MSMALLLLVGACSSTQAPGLRAGSWCALQHAQAPAGPADPATAALGADGCSAGPLSGKQGRGGLHDTSARPLVPRGTSTAHFCAQALRAAYAGLSRPKPGRSHC